MFQHQALLHDSKGVTNYTQTQKRNRLVNSLLIALGLISGNLTAAGTGMIANSRQTMN